MTDRRFRLAGLLRLRRLQEDQVAAALARANADEQAARRRVERAQESVASSTLPASASAATYQAAVAGRAALVGLAQESRIAALDAVQRVHDVQADWADARRRTRVLDKLAERHADVVRREDLADEQKVLDESAARIRRTEAPS